MAFLDTDGVAIRCGGWAGPEAVAAAVVASGFRPMYHAALVVTDAGVAELSSEVLARAVVLVSEKAEATRALVAGAAGAVVWPGEAPMLGRALLAARNRLRDTIGHVVYREAFRRSPVWMELANDDVTLLDVSDGFVAGSGYRADEAVGQTPGELFRGGTHGPAYYEAIVRSLDQHGAWRGDMVSRRRDGSLALIDATVHRVRCADGDFAQFAIKRPVGSPRPGTVSSWVHDRVARPWLLVDGRTTEVVEVGPAIDQVLGLGREQVLARSLVELDLDALALPVDEGMVQQDLWLGERAYAIRAVRRLLGDSPVVLVVFDDVTERLRREEELDALAADLAMARDQAMAADQAKSAFLAGMSHELRTPLTAILGYADLLRDDLDQPQQQADLGHIRTAGTQLLALVDEVLDLARVESGELLLTMEAFAARPVLVEVADSVRLRAQVAGKEIVVVAPDDATAWGDRHRVRQVVLNLVVNAVKYAVPGRIEVGLQVEGERSVFYVQDLGPGLTLRQQRGIFHAFRQLHDVSEGVGLGLAISRRLAEAMGGSLEVRSAPGEGSRFLLLLRARSG